MKRLDLMKPIAMLLCWTGGVPVELLSPHMPNDDRVDRHEFKTFLEIFCVDWL
jgi:hypothetical protein